MDIFCHDTKLNLSPYYLQSGFAFGGSCLPKDVRADLQGRRWIWICRFSMPCAQYQQPIEQGLRLDSTETKIGILGFSFKGGTDDLLARWWR
jgi:GDP-mannose 6-dehydrogenase